MIIRKGNPADLLYLSALWQEAFEESREDVQNFYETAFSLDRCMVAVEQNPVAGIYWIDAHMADRKVAYLYALAVDTAYRGKGIGKTLLEQTLHTLKRENYAAAILVPAEESLYDYYQKVGFVPFGKTEERLVQKKAPGIPAEKVTAEAYFALRQNRKAAIAWGQEAICYMERFCDLYAGEGWLLAMGREGVQEFIGNPEDLPHILYTLNIEEVSLNLPGGKPCAMAYCFTPVTLTDTFAPSF